MLPPREHSGVSVHSPTTKFRSSQFQKLTTHSLTHAPTHNTIHWGPKKQLTSCKKNYSKFDIQRNLSDSMHILNANILILNLLYFTLGSEWVPPNRQGLNSKWRWREKLFRQVEHNVMLTCNLLHFNTYCMENIWR